jgi:hypothetical protein
MMRDASRTIGNLIDKQGVALISSARAIKIFPKEESAS